MVNDSTTPTGALSPFGDESCAIGHPGAGAPESVWKMSDDRQYAPATLRNRDVILDVLRHVLPTTGVILEIASGSGEHIVHFARNFPTLAFQPSDKPDALSSIAAWVKAAGATNVCAPIGLDAAHSVWPIASADGIICINMVHISPWEATLGLIKGAAAILPPASPFSISMVHTNAKGSQRPRATKYSIGAFAIATHAGVCATSKRLSRWRNLLDSRLRLSLKCPQTI